MQNLFPQLIWRKKTTEKVIYLTFDDGPIPEVTPWVLQLLKKYNAHATFFCIGDNVNKHTQIFHQIIKSNHAIGNHTYNHLNGWQTNLKTYVANTQKCQDALQNQTNLFRPPYGKITKKQIKAIKNKGFQIIMWDVLSNDYVKDLNTEKAIKKIIKHTSLGSIIVFHDSLKAFENLKKLLPAYLDYFSKKGFAFKKL